MSRSRFILNNYDSKNIRMNFSHTDPLRTLPMQTSFEYSNGMHPDRCITTIGLIDGINPHIILPFPNKQAAASPMNGILNFKQWHIIILIIISPIIFCRLDCICTAHMTSMQSTSMLGIWAVIYPPYCRNINECGHIFKIV